MRVFYTCNITDGAYKGVGGWEGGEGVVWVGGQDEGGLSLPLSHREWTVLSTDDKNAHRIDRYGHWQQFGTQPIKQVHKQLFIRH